MIRKKELLGEIKRLENCIKKILDDMSCMDYKVRILCDYADHFDALTNYLELDFDITPAIGKKIKVMKKKK